VRMVTGDNMITARAIAINCGIIQKDDKEALVMEASRWRHSLPAGVRGNRQLTAVGRRRCRGPISVAVS
jgi:magnesium-transporting ATPase (P-type)